MGKSARPLSEQVRAAGAPEQTPTIALGVLIPMTLGFFAITGLLLWLGAVLAVECTRAPDGRVAVAVEHRLLGLWAVHRAELSDVVGALAVQQTGGPRRGGRGGPGAQLQLTLRDGTTWESPAVPRHVVGSGPRDMAERIQAFLDQPDAATLHLRWIPWLMCGLAVPFVLASALFAMVWVNLLRRSIAGGA